MFEPSLCISYVDGQAPQTEFEKKTPVELKLDYPPLLQHYSI